MSIINFFYLIAYQIPSLLRFCFSNLNYPLINGQHSTIYGAVQNLAHNATLTYHVINVTRGPKEDLTGGTISPLV